MLIASRWMKIQKCAISAVQVYILSLKYRKVLMVDVVIIGAGSSGFSQVIESSIMRCFMATNFSVIGTSTPNASDCEVSTIPDIPIYAPAVINDVVEVVKKKQPNFTRFQNNFKRRGR